MSGHRNVTEAKLMKSIVAIPARLESTRFPRKLLVDINGHPMLWHVYQAVMRSESIESVWILTDSEEIFDIGSSWGANVLMTDKSCPSGTARIASVADKLDADLIINVQGDEPLIKSYVVDELVAALQKGVADVSTPVFAIDTIKEINDPNLVKVVRDRDGRALYFSRSPIPYVRDSDPEEWPSQTQFWGHVGAYAYTKQILLDYNDFPMGDLETVEKLEQLRLLELGKKIATVEIDYRPCGVDVPEDLDLVKTLMDVI